MGALHDGVDVDVLVGLHRVDLDAGQVALGDHARVGNDRDLARQAVALAAGSVHDVRDGVRVTLAGRLGVTQPSGGDSERSASDMSLTQLTGCTKWSATTACAAS